MKIPVSIPDDAEHLASRLKTSHSKLYLQTLSQFVAQQDNDRITAAMNQVVEEVGGEIDGFTRHTGQQTLGRVEW